MLATVTVWGIAFMTTEILMCDNDGHAGHPSCGGAQWTVLWFAITDVISDIIILSMPYPMIRKLQMSRRDKIGLSTIFLLGTLFVHLNHILI